MAEALQIVAAVSFVVAGFLVSLACGFIVVGCMCGLAGLVLEAKVRRRGTSQPPS